MLSVNLKLNIRVSIQFIPQFLWKLLTKCNIILRLLLIILKELAVQSRIGIIHHFMTSINLIIASVQLRINEEFIIFSRKQCFRLQNLRQQSHQLRILV